METTSRQFSLRTLLLATTIVGVALGLYCYLRNRPPSSPPLTHGDFIDTNPEFTH